MTPDGARPAAGFRLASPFGASAFGLMLLALALRLRGAAGTLWLDEIWSVKLAGWLREGRYLVEGLAVDNNHYLNTLYLALVGPEASPLLQRGLAILLGVATVPAAGYALRRTGTVGMLAAMLLFAVGYPLVNYGSEARGYAGLILATVLAIALVERALDAPDRKGGGPIALVALLGVLFQPVMALSLAMLGLWVVWLEWRDAGNIRIVARRTWSIFGATAACLLPVAVLIGGAVFTAGDYLIAAKTPFSLANFLAGYAGLYRTLLGIPDAVPDAAVLIAPLVVLGAAGVLRLRRFSLGVIAMVVLPLAILAAHLPNVQYPRYYLASGVVFLLLLAELCAVAVQSGRVWTALAGLLTLAVLAGNAVEIARLYRDGRGDPLPALHRIAEAGGSVLVDTRDHAVVDYLAPRVGLAIAAVDLADLCGARPAFLLLSDLGPQPETTTVTRPDCAVTYRRDMVVPHWGLSGAPWTLYRKAE